MKRLKKKLGILLAAVLAFSAIIPTAILNADVPAEREHAHEHFPNEIRIALAEGQSIEEITAFLKSEDGKLFFDKMAADLEALFESQSYKLENAPIAARATLCPIGDCPGTNYGMIKTYVGRAVIEGSLYDMYVEDYSCTYTRHYVNEIYELIR